MRTSYTAKNYNENGTFLLTITVHMIINKAITHHQGDSSVKENFLPRF